uniref:Colony stimulating factor 2 receptor subunit beta n=1 Tax=Sphenodon punctatus TaxID=8508 RepID=A0A8D0L7Y6_SPHPU
MREFCSVLLALCFTFGAGEVRESVLMHSLHCYNDYRTHIACTWAENRDTQHLLGMKLYHNNNLYIGHRNLTQIPCKKSQAPNGSDCQRATVSPINSDSQVCWSCRRDTSHFIVGLKDTFSFKPVRELQTQLNMTLSQNIQLSPPQKPEVNVTETGDFILSWKAATGTKRSQWFPQTLEFEVAYKRDWESWENSSSVSVSNTSQYLLGYNHLVPGSTYVARVRSKPWQYGGISGHYSEWSPQESWKLEPGDEAQPKNLHCVFNGVDQLRCSWEVSKRVTSSVLFTLFYSIPPAPEEVECSPVHEADLPNTLYVSQTCEVNISSPSRLSQYLITVRPKEETRLIKAYLNIRPQPPFNLSLTVTKKQDYKLEWKKATIGSSNINQMYQILYWKNGSNSSENLCINVTTDETWCTFTQAVLESATRYRAKVRAKVHDPSQAYKGPWSEWSEELGWETESVWPPWSPVVMTLVFTTVLIACFWFGCKYLLSKKKKWEEMIPDPSKSHLLQVYLQKVLLTDGDRDSSKPSPSEKKPTSCVHHGLESRTNLINCVPSPGADSMVLHLTTLTLEEQMYFRPDHASLPSAPVEEGLGQNCFDFNGPYLHYPETYSLPNGQENPEAALAGMKVKAVSLEYVSLPEASSPQPLLVEEERTVHAFSPTTLPDQKKVTQQFTGGKEIAQGQPEGRGMEKVEIEGQGSPTSVTMSKSYQKLSLGYITADKLSFTSAGDAFHPSPGLAPLEGKLTSVNVLLTSNSSQQPQTTEGSSGTELGPEEPSITISGEYPGSAAPSELPQNAFGSYLMFPTNPLSTSETFSKDLPKAEPMQNNTLVMLNPDGSGPVFLRQFLRYCAFPAVGVFSCLWKTAVT